MRQNLTRVFSVVITIAIVTSLTTLPATAGVGWWSYNESPRIIVDYQPGRTQSDSGTAPSWYLPLLYALAFPLY